MEAFVSHCSSQCFMTDSCDRWSSISSNTLRCIEATLIYLKKSTKPTHFMRMKPRDVDENYHFDINFSNLAPNQGQQPAINVTTFFFLADLKYTLNSL